MRSLLFVPSDSERKLANALGSGADALILDLEDAVVPARKPLARAAAADFISNARKGAVRPRLLVRVNSLDGGLIDADLDAVTAVQPDAIVLPKTEGRAGVLHLDAKLTAHEARSGLPEGLIQIMIVIETGRSLFTAGQYRNISPRLFAMTFGAEDLALDLGAEANRDADANPLDAFRLARALCLAGAAAAGITALDGICTDFRNEGRLRREAEAARRDGFSGKVAIHPAQVGIINSVFTASPEQLAHARTIVAAFAAAPDAGALSIDGVMVDRPHLVRAQRLLAANSSGAEES